MNRFTDKTVIVTGAAGALGSCMVRRFAAEGANVVIGARREEQVTELVNELGDSRAVFARLDVTSEQAWATAIQTAEQTFGPISILVNNAARAIVGTTMSLKTDEFREVINTNLIGTFLGMRAVVPSMRRAGGGSIVNINSTAGLGVAAGLAAYGTSKWAIRGLTRIAAKELGRDGIRVNGIHPGIIETPLAYNPDHRQPHRRRRRPANAPSSQRRRDQHHRSLRRLRRRLVLDRHGVRRRRRLPARPDRTHNLTRLTLCEYQLHLRCHGVGMRMRRFADEAFGRAAERAGVVGVRDLGWAVERRSSGWRRLRMVGWRVRGGGLGAAVANLLFLYYTLAVWNFTARLASTASRTKTSSTPLRTRSRATPSKTLTTNLAEHCSLDPTVQAICSSSSSWSSTTLVGS